MPPQNKLEKVKTLLSIVNDGSVTYDQVKRLVSQLIEFVRGVKQELDKRISADLEAIEKRVDTRLAETSAFEKGITSRFNEQRAATASDNRTFQRLVRDELKRLEALIPPDYDDTGIKGELAALAKSIPKEYDASAIIERLDKLSERIEDVGRRQVNGVTNLRIQQAFKYILKTEAPTGAINGSNTEYTVTQPIFAVLAFSLNGETIAQLPNYTIRGNKVVFSSALPAAYSGKDFEIKYI